MDASLAVEQATARLDVSPGDRAPQPSRSWRVRTGRIVTEAALALAAAAAMVLLSLSIEVNPLTRIGQVSGLAGLDLRFAVIGVLTLAAVALPSQFLGHRWASLSVRLACPVVAGLGSGVVAGGIVVALRGTSLPLFGHFGDAGTLARWAQSIVDGHSTLPAVYPPAVPHLLAWWSVAGDIPTSAAFKHVEVLGTALLGPAAYLAWRLLCRPELALLIGSAATLPLLDPYKPYEAFVLVILVPVLAKAIHYLAATPRQPARRIVLAGTGFGAALGVLFLIYSGWFLWAALGVVAAAAIAFPWRRGARRGLLFGAVTSAVFVLVSLAYLIPLLQNWSTAKSKDTYFAFDVFVDPAYVEMWRTDLPGHVATWPPSGALGGVGMFTLLLVVGLGVALVLGHRNPIVITAACTFGGAWLIRMYYASQMYADQNVRLYPRTSLLIVYCLLILVVIAAWLAFTRLRESRPGFLSAGNGGRRGVRVPAGGLAVLAGMLFLLGSAGSATADKYMPAKDNSLGRLAWVGQTQRMESGDCSAYLQPDCRTVRRVHPPHHPPGVLSPHTGGGDH